MNLKDKTVVELRHILCCLNEQNGTEFRVRVQDAYNLQAEKKALIRAIELSNKEAENKETPPEPIIEPDVWNIKYKMNRSSSGNTLGIKLTSAGADRLSGKVYWGDSNNPPENFLATSNDITVSHTYSSPGVYNTFILFDDKSMLTSFNDGQADDSELINMYFKDTGIGWIPIELYLVGGKFDRLGNDTTELFGNNPILMFNRLDVSLNNNLIVVNGGSLIIYAFDIEVHDCDNVIEVISGPGTISLNVPGAAVVALLGGGTGVSTLMQLNLSANVISTANINQLLSDIDTQGLLAGSIDVSGQTPAAPPDTWGVTAKNNLIGKGWTVVTD